ncbi:hypothetical protein D9M72_395430 [compost metagenome]
MPGSPEKTSAMLAGFFSFRSSDEMTISPAPSGPLPKAEIGSRTVAPDASTPSLLPAAVAEPISAVPPDTR